MVLHGHNITYKKKPSKQTNTKKKKKKEKRKKRGKKKNENAEIFLRSGQRGTKTTKNRSAGRINAVCVEKFRILVERAFRRNRGYADASAAPRINKLCRVSAYPVGVTPYVENQYPIHIRLPRILAEVRFSACLSRYLTFIAMLSARYWRARGKHTVIHRACPDFRR